MKNKYKVVEWGSNYYEVVENVVLYDRIQPESRFVGSLSDCAAWIALKEKDMI